MLSTLASRTPLRAALVSATASATATRPASVVLLRPFSSLHLQSSTLRAAAPATTTSVTTAVRSYHHRHFNEYNQSPSSSQSPSSDPNNCNSSYYGGRYGNRYRHGYPRERGLRNLAKVGVSVGAGVMVFSLTKPLFFLIVGGGLGFGAYRLTRNWLDIQFPPNNGGYQAYGGPSDAAAWSPQVKPWNAAAARSPLMRSGPFAATDPVSAVLRSAAGGFRNTDGDMQRVLRWSTHAARTLGLVSGPHLLQAATTAFVVQDAAVRRAVLAAVDVNDYTLSDATPINAPTVSFGPFRSASESFASVRTGSDAAAVVRSDLEIEFDAVASTGQSVPIRAAGSLVARPAAATNPATDRVVVKWVQVGDGPRIAVPEEAEFVDAAKPTSPSSSQ
ncbi:hypothetical protein BC828DRAFT_403515 [Blastocladiella britannica]|nr:hypothetical protein BC828DRAFT_403515 [Blastocladiella britannica]